jgi:hypothetical protein
MKVELYPSNALTPVALYGPDYDCSEMGRKTVAFV